MKIFKLLLVASCAAGLLMNAARAAEETAPTAPPPEKPKQHAAPHNRIDAIDRAVGGLTAEQKAKINAIFEKNGAALREAKGPERRTLMQAQRDEIRGVLTAEQQPKFDAMPADGHGKGKKKDQAAQ